MTKTLTFRTCWVHISPNYVETVFHDGTKVTATPEDTDSYRATAEKLGYDDTEKMSREHEVLHTFLYDRLHGTASPTLWAVAHNQENCAPIWQQEQEETLVLAFQCYMNGEDFDPSDLLPIHRYGHSPADLLEQARELLR